ncbi:Vancomycin resistance protein YoaR, contains peptidoglycan-binding and VanW domains [Marininema mesophilum]|uniref:Vancomycin resistance protein YoaR, contains peptidoglycan-binding and VanW domains n=1 Tax=Marininema mesophilum TaxID=1048340 RepID=A0A1H2QNP9_9BACL|nr:VanW family protein [Marininema mesophilum]SDW08530.1 Vancomycin resistance protein YoaR, contains peptidoglycan-binding and VanW domains [Marininema mesophilum]
MNGNRIWLWVLTLAMVCGCSSGIVRDPVAKQIEKPDPGQKNLKRVHTPVWLGITDGSKVWRVDLTQMGYDGVDPTSVDRKAFHRWLTQVGQEFDRAPRNARLENERIIPHANGRKLNRVVIEQWLDQIHEHVDQTRQAPMQLWRPRITTAMLTSIREKRLSSYTTRYNTYHWNRSHNIDLSVRAIHNQVIPRGGSFSFNQIVGVRSTARGYRPAPIIVRGEYTEGIGGGICQTSSTLYNSVDRAGLRILQRSSHSKYVTYVPKGRDATVAWGGPDFRFQNQLNRPVLIQAKAVKGWLNISIYGAADTIFSPRYTPDPPKKEPQTQEDLTPTEKQPLDNTGRQYENPPLPQTGNGQ